MQQEQSNPALFRILPFAFFMAFIGLDEAIRFLADHKFLNVNEQTLLYLYPVKAITTAFILLRYRKKYSELSFKDLQSFSSTVIACCAGILVFFLWIKMDWTFGATGRPKGFNPELLQNAGLQVFMILSRISGAVLVVPVMEELFWRSFLIRYIIDKNFQKVAVGAFSWTSFVISVVLFGLEHHFVFAGMMAGSIYNLLLYRTKSLAQCVVSHAVTNLALAIYVLCKGKWFFW